MFGANLTQATSFNDMLARMGANFNIERREISTSDGVRVPNRYATVRGDTRHPLGVVSDRFKIIQPRDMLAPVAQIVRETKGTDHAWRPERGACFDGGGRVWARFAVNGRGAVGNVRNDNEYVKAFVDVVVPNDGTASVTARLSTNSTACDNSNATFGVIRISHVGDVEGRLEAWRQAADQLATSWHKTLELYNTLARHRMPTSRISIEDSIRAYCAAVFGRQEREAQISGDTNRSRALLDAYRSAPGSDLAPRQGTGWGLYQALTHYLTHHRTMSERRAASLIDGAAQRTSQRGIEVAYAMAVKQIPLEDVLDANSPAMQAVHRELVD